MTMHRRPLHALAIVAGFIGVMVMTTAGQQQQPQQPQDSRVFRFKTGIELINVTATVSDGSGRFVSGLQKTDFRLFEDGEEQQITHFNSERVPVSLGLVVDTSGSMEGEKWAAARQALNKFLFQLLDKEDEVFLYRFDNMPELVEGWTTDRERIAAGLGRIRPRGATALYDAVTEAIPLVESGKHRKKALVVISDGNDTNSRANIRELKRMLRESEVLVYAIGIDTQGLATTDNSQPSGPIVIEPPLPGPRSPVPQPFPTPGGPRPQPQPPQRTPTRPTPPSGGTLSRSRLDDRVNVAALRDITDDSGGRTEIVRSARDLDPATTSVADELSKQYYLGYPSQGKRDGKWHTIRVELRNNAFLVRARRGYVASP